MKTFSIKYLSNGPKNTGGFFHERFWFEQIQQYYTDQGHKVNADAERPTHYHSGLWTKCQWFWHLFKVSDADITIVPGRCALPVLLRNLFTKRRVLVVLHSLNSTSLHKNKTLAFYYSFIFRLIKMRSNFFLVTVAEYWQTYFCEKKRIPSKRVLLLPNLFEAERYLEFKSAKKKLNIHLGMWSTKLDKVLYDIASRLSHRGYYCFFTTPEDIMSMGAYGYDIIYCPTINEYKTRVANALFTISIPAVPEGWSRVAHESFLLGTPVIGYNNAGLGELLHEAGGYIANNTDEVLQIIESKCEWKLSQTFVQKFHAERARQFLNRSGL